MDLTNRLKARLRAGKVAVGAQLRFGVPAVAELFGLAGFDWLLIDTEHAPQTAPGVQAQLQAAAGTGATAIVRAAKNDADLIRLYLDMGAAGIVVPFINTPEEAAAGAKACRYPPRGTRGWGPHRAAGYGLAAAEYTAAVDDQVLYAPIIESAAAIAHIEAILAVDGVDAAIVGLVDLAISLGVPFDFGSAAYGDALAAVLEASRATGTPVGIGVQGSAFEAGFGRREVEAGFRLLLLGGDEWFLAHSCRTVLANVAGLRQ